MADKLRIYRKIKMFQRLYIMYGRLWDKCNSNDRITQLGLALDHPDVEDRVCAFLLDKLAAERAAMNRVINDFPRQLIQIGYQSPETFWVGLRKHHSVCPQADPLLEQVKVATHPATVELVVATGAEMGLHNGIICYNVHHRIASFGGKRVSSEAALQVCLQDFDLFGRGLVMVAVEEPIINADGQPMTFRIEQTGSKRVAHAISCGPNDHCDLSRAWLFTPPPR